MEIGLIFYGIIGHRVINYSTFFFFYLDLIYSRILQKFELNSQIKYHT